MDLLHLAPFKAGPWRPHRHEVFRILKPLIRPGDILLRLGNAYVFGFIHFSGLVAAATDSLFSHAALVIDTDKDILIADIDGLGIHRQFLTDWCDNIAGNELWLLRFTGDPAVAERAVAECWHFIREDVPYDEKFENKPDKLYCVQLIYECYQRAGVRLGPPTAVWEMRGMRWWLWPVVYYAGVKANQELYHVGNTHCGLLASPLVRPLVQLLLPQGGGSILP